MSTTKICKRCRYGAVAHLFMICGYEETKYVYCTQTNDIHKQNYTCDKYKAMPRVCPNLSTAQFDEALDNAQFLLAYVEKLRKLCERFR